MQTYYITFKEGTPNYNTFETIEAESLEAARLEVIAKYGYESWAAIYTKERWEQSADFERLNMGKK